MATRKRRAKVRRKAKRRPVRSRKGNIVQQFLSASSREVRKFGKSTRKLANKAIAKVRSLKYV